MHLDIANIGKIKSASLELNGITVITGNNNSGKSTVGKTVYALFNSLVDIQEKINRQRVVLVYQILKRQTQIYSKVAEDVYSSRSFPNHLFLQYAQLIVETMSADVSSRECFRLQQFIGRVGETLEGFEENLIEEIDRVFQLSEEKLVRMSLTKEFREYFSDEINNKFQSGEKASIKAVIHDKQISFSFEQNNCEDLVQQIEILNEAVYIDNPFILNNLERGYNIYDDYEKAVLYKLKGDFAQESNIVQKGLMEERLSEVLGKLSSISDGVIEKSEQQVYLYKEKSGITFNICNLSAGLKSFVIIKTLLENQALNDKDVLILDEPEIHLHPQWQIDYAESIVLLQKALELTVIITTHSTQFLEAIELFTKKYESKDISSYYLAEESEKGTIFKNVTGDLTEIYTKLVNPSILLDKLRFELESAEDE